MAHLSLCASQSSIMASQKRWWCSSTRRSKPGSSRDTCTGSGSGTATLIHQAVQTGVIAGHLTQRRWARREAGLAGGSWGMLLDADTCCTEYRLTDTGACTHREVRRGAEQRRWRGCRACLGHRQGGAAHADQGLGVGQEARLGEHPSAPEHLRPGRAQKKGGTEFMRRHALVAGARSWEERHAAQAAHARQEQQANAGSVGSQDNAGSAADCAPAGSCQTGGGTAAAASSQRCHGRTPWW